jgi:hypothetical protein
MSELEDTSSTFNAGKRWLETDENIHEVFDTLHSFFCEDSTEEKELLALAEKRLEQIFKV